MVTEPCACQKFYDLTERVLPSVLNTSMPSDDEFFVHLIMKYLHAHSIGTVSEMSYLRRGTKAKVPRRCEQMIEIKQ